MKRLFLLLILIAEINPVYSQQYDLIVKSSGDSIACKIDSISDASIYFKMRSNKYWIQTYLDKEYVNEYQYNTIDWDDFIYKPGS